MEPKWGEFALLPKLRWPLDMFGQYCEMTLSICQNQLAKSAIPQMEHVSSEKLTTASSQKHAAPEVWLVCS